MRRLSSGGRRAEGECGGLEGVLSQESMRGRLVGGRLVFSAEGR